MLYLLLNTPHYRWVEAPRCHNYPLRNLLWMVAIPYNPSNQTQHKTIPFIMFSLNQMLGRNHSIPRSNSSITFYLVLKLNMPKISNKLSQKHYLCYHQRTRRDKRLSLHYVLILLFVNMTLIRYQCSWLVRIPLFVYMRLVMHHHLLRFRWTILDICWSQEMIKRWWGEMKDFWSGDNAPKHMRMNGMKMKGEGGVGRNISLVFLQGDGG